MRHFFFLYKIRNRMHAELTDNWNGKAIYYICTTAAANTFCRVPARHQMINGHNYDIRWHT